MWRGDYKRWNPVPYLEGKILYVEAVHDDWEGFRIWLSSENTKLGVVSIVKFEIALLYINSNESYRLSGEPLDFPHTFWQVENSALIEEFNRQSVKIYEAWEIKHFAFLSASDCVDVLSLNFPTFDNLLEKDDLTKDAMIKELL